MPAADARPGARARRRRRDRPLPQQKLRVVTTSSDLKALVEAVGGERVEVESLAAPEQDPHAVEIKPAQLARVRSAALVVRIGLDHEPWFSRLKARAPVVLDASRGVRLLQTQKRPGCASSAARTCTLTAIRITGSTRERAADHCRDPRCAREAEPGRRALLRRQTGRVFIDALDNEIEGWKRLSHPFAGSRLVVIHDSWSYFAERFGLAVRRGRRAAPGVPPSPAELAALFKRMREAGVRLLIADPHSNPSLVRQIAERRRRAAQSTLSPSVGDRSGGSTTTFRFSM